MRTHGWLSGSGFRLEEALRLLTGYAPAAVIVTDIHRDGMLQGPNFKMIEDCLSLSRAPIILSGGISSLEDIRSCDKIQSPIFDGVIIGKALYEKKLSFQEALKIACRKE